LPDGQIWHCLMIWGNGVVPAIGPHSQHLP